MKDAGHIVLNLPVRFTGDRVQEFSYSTLPLNPGETALLLIDCDGDCGSTCTPVIDSHIAPAVAACRTIGVRPVYLYNESRPNRSREMVREIHYGRRGRPLPSSGLNPASPDWANSIKPQRGDVVIGKREQSGFIGTDLDAVLRGLGVDTLLAVGFSFESCLFQTLVNAFQHNYRVVFLRDGTDPPGTNEFPDTGNDSLPEQGWVRLVLTRLIEDHLGYSSTCKELIDMCERVHDPPVIRDHEQRSASPY